MESTDEVLLVLITSTNFQGGYVFIGISYFVR